MSLLPTCWSARVQQVNERKHEHPDQIHEMPIESGRFNVARIQPAPSIELGHDSNSDHTAYDVQQVQSRDAEKRSAKKRGATERVMAWAPSFVDHRRPFPQVQTGEHQSQQHRRAEPANRGWATGARSA